MTLTTKQRKNLIVMMRLAPAVLTLVVLIFIGSHAMFDGHAAKLQLQFLLGASIIIGLSALLAEKLKQQKTET